MSPDQVPPVPLPKDMKPLQISFKLYGLEAKEFRAALSRVHYNPELTRNALARMIVEAATRSFAEMPKIPWPVALEVRHENGSEIRRRVKAMLFLPSQGRGPLWSSEN
jgi:hypothetical protein